MVCPHCKGIGVTNIGGYPLWRGIHSEMVSGPVISVQCSLCKGLCTVPDDIAKSYAEEQRIADQQFLHIWIPVLALVAIIICIAAAAV